MIPGMTVSVARVFIVYVCVVFLFFDIFTSPTEHVERALDHHLLRHTRGLATHPCAERGGRFPSFHERVDSTVATEGGRRGGDDQPYDLRLSVLCEM